MRIDPASLIEWQTRLTLLLPSGVSYLRASALGDVDGDGRDDLGFVVLDGFVNSTLSYTGWVSRSTDGWMHLWADTAPSGTNLPAIPSQVAALGDVTGDGRADLGFSNLHAAAYRFNYGAGQGPIPYTSAQMLDPLAGGYVVAGGSGLLNQVRMSELGTATPGAIITGGFFGRTASIGPQGAGDFNGDGINDLALAGAVGLVPQVVLRFGAAPGSPLSPTSGLGGLTYLAQGSESLALPEVAAGVSVSALTPSAALWPAFLGDVDGDGFDDVAISQAQRVLILHGRAGDGVPQLRSGQIAPGTHATFLEGYTAAIAAGDINGDGHADFIARRNAGDAPTQTAIAGITVFLGGPGGPAPAFSMTFPAGYTGEVTAAGDLNGDGYDDLLFSRQRLLPNGVAGNAEDSVVLFGRAVLPAAIDLAAEAAGQGGLAIATYREAPTAPNDQSFQFALPTAAGDVNGDGFDDLLLPGAPGQATILLGRDFTGSQAGSTPGADALAGTPGNDTLEGGGGADALRGGAGDDLLVVADTGFRLADGGTGTDTLRLSGSGLTLALTGDGPRRVTEMERLDLGGNTLRVTALGVLNASGMGNALTVTGGAGASVVIADAGWLRGASAAGFTTFTNGGATLRIADALAPANAAGAPRFIGTGAAEAATGSAGDDILDGGGGADTLLGLGGNDVLAVRDVLFARVDGGAGTDTLLLDGQGLRLNLAGLPAGALTGIEALDLGGGGNAVLLTAASVLAATGGEGTLRVSGAPGDAVGFLDTGWALSAGPGGQTQYTKAGATVLVEREITGNRAAVGSLSEMVAAGSGSTATGLSPGGLAFSNIAFGDLNGDGFRDMAVGAPGAFGGQGAVYVLWGTANGLGPAMDLGRAADGTGGFVVTGGAVAGSLGGAPLTLGTSQALGTSLAIADLDGDGRAELVMGAPGYDSTGSFRLAQGIYDDFGRDIAGLGGLYNPDFGSQQTILPQARPDAGAIFVLRGAPPQAGATIDLSQIAAGTRGWMWEGMLAGDRAGANLANVGDYTLDGRPDIAFGTLFRYQQVSSQHADDWLNYVGYAQLSNRLTILPGGAAGDPVRDLAAPGARVLVGSNNALPDAARPFAASLGDMNGDGATEIYAYGWEIGESVRFGGDANAERSVGLNTGTPLDPARVVGVGDVNGDGLADVLVANATLGAQAALGRDGAGIVALHLGFAAANPPGSFSASVSILPGTAQPFDRTIAPSFGQANPNFTRFIVGESAHDGAGRFIGAGGDINGDGRADILVGNAAGDLYVVLGGLGTADAVIDLAVIAKGAGGFVLRGALAGGTTVAGPGDLTGDGIGDLVFTTPSAAGGAGSITILAGRDVTLRQAVEGASANRTGTAASDTLHAGFAASTLAGGEGGDSLVGGDGDDILRGEGGDDILRGARGSDTLDGGPGQDTATYEGLAPGFALALTPAGGSDGIGGTDGFVSIENVTGGEGNDTINFGAAAGATTLRGNGGNDRLTGGGGDDLLLGGGGTDTLAGGAGNDTLNGGEGTDTADYSANAAGQGISLGPTGGLDGLGGTDSFVAGIEHVRGGAGDDLVRLGGGLATFEGGAGTDTVDFGTAGSFAVAADGQGGFTVTGPGGASFVLRDVELVHTTAGLQPLAAGQSYAVPCFLRGTRIATPAGERAVEELRPGDLLLTLDGEAMPLRWVGRRGYRQRFLSGNAQAIRPVAFAPGSLGDGLPRRPLLVSPEHAMLVDGVLVPAALLANGAGIRQVEGPETIEYFHLEMDSHAILLAEGAPTESFLDLGSAGLFVNAGERLAAHGGVLPPRVPCRPRVEAGEALARIRARLGGGLAPATAAPGGHLDAVTRRGVRGWAALPGHPELSPELEVRVNGVVVAELVARAPRPDVASAGAGPLRSGFSVAFEPPLDPAGTHLVEVRLAGGGPLLGQRLLAPAPSADALGLLLDWAATAAAQAPVEELDATIEAALAALAGLERRPPALPPSRRAA